MKNLLKKKLNNLIPLIEDSNVFRYLMKKGEVKWL